MCMFLLFSFCRSLLVSCSFFSTKIDDIGHSSIHIVCTCTCLPDRGTFCLRWWNPCTTNLVTACHKSYLDCVQSLQTIASVEKKSDHISCFFLLKFSATPSIIIFQATVNYSMFLKNSIIPVLPLFFLLPNCHINIQFCLSSQLKIAVLVLIL